jgi:outer membrane protein assembly factor BamB
MPQYPGDNMEDGLLYIGVRGTVLALDRRTGGEVWRAPLKGSDFVNLVKEGDQLLAATRGEIFCLDARTGALIWSNGLRGMGYGIVSIAGAPQPPAAALTAQMDEERRRSSSSASVG